MSCLMLAPLGVAAAVWAHLCSLMQHFNVTRCDPTQAREAATRERFHPNFLSIHQNQEVLYKARWSKTIKIESLFSFYPANWQARVQSPSPKQISRTRVTLKSYGSPNHPPTAQSKYMVQIEAQSTLECQEGVLSPVGQRDEENSVVHHVQVEHYQKKSQYHKPKSKIPGLFPVDY